MNASVLPRRCSAKPVQLPTVKHRHRDLVPLRLRAAERAAVEIVVQPEPQRVGLPAVGQVLRRAAERVMHQVRGEPVGHEHAEDAAVEQRVAIDVGEALPRDDRLQRRRLEIGDEPLVDREIGNAGQADIAVAPRLRRRPFDRVVEVDRFRERPRLALAGRLAAAAPVDAHGGVAARHPPFRVDGLPVHQRRSRLPPAVGGGTQSLSFWYGPRLRMAGKRAAAVGPEHVGLQPRAVAHRHVDVFFDQEPVGGVGWFSSRHGARRCRRREVCSVHLDLHFGGDLPPIGDLAVQPGLRLVERVVRLDADELLGERLLQLRAPSRPRGSP